MGVNGSFLYWLSAMSLKVQSLTLSCWKIATLYGLEGSQHTRRTKHPHCSISKWWVLCVDGRNCGLSPVTRWPAWKMKMSTSLHMPFASSRRQRVFRVEWSSFQSSPGKWLSQFNGTLHLGQKQPNGILKNWSVCLLGVHVVRWLTVSAEILDFDAPKRWMTVLCLGRERWCGGISDLSLLYSKCMWTILHAYVTHYMSPFTDSSLLKTIDGAHLDCVVKSHPAMVPMMHLLPENVLVSGDENIPGLAASPTGKRHIAGKVLGQRIKNSL